MPRCGVPGCANDAEPGGEMCWSHQWHVDTYGSPFIGRPTPPELLTPDLFSYILAQKRHRVKGLAETQEAKRSEVLWSIALREQGLR